jgi:hypothetical protein
MSDRIIEAALWASLAEARQEAPISRRGGEHSSASLALQGGNAGQALDQGLPIGLCESRPLWTAREELTAQSQSLLPVAVGQQAVVADPYEAVRQDVQKEPSEKLHTREGHLAQAVALPNRRLEHPLNPAHDPGGANPTLLRVDPRNDPPPGRRTAIPTPAARPDTSPPERLAGAPGRTPRPRPLVEFPHSLQRARPATGPPCFRQGRLAPYIIRMSGRRTDFP